MDYLNTKLTAHFHVGLDYNLGGIYSPHLQLVVEP